MATSPNMPRDVGMPNMSDPMSWLNPGNLAAAAAFLFSQNPQHNGLGIPSPRNNQADQHPAMNMSVPNLGSNPIDLSLDQQSASKLPKKVNSETPTRSRNKSKKTLE